jgi:ubiquinone/menaquinone biosynthesis C-methylase UbiE
MDILAEVKELRKLWGSFMQSRVLLTANNLRVFDHLKTAKSASELASLLSTDARATEILLDALSGLRLLKKSKGRYRNSAAANKLLVTGMPYYQGDIIRHADHLWTNWSGLDETVRTGRPSRASFGTDSFIRGMHNIAATKARELINSLNLKGISSALDLGGGPGTYSIELAKKIKSVTLFDLPETVPIAREIIGKSGLKNISFIEGDFTSDAIGSGYDLVFISQILHSFSEAGNMMLLRKVFSALAPGGLLIIQEHLLGPDRTTPPHGSLFSVNMLVNTSGGRSYSVLEMKRWLSQIGYKKISHKQKEDVSLVFGRKPVT